MLKIMLSTMPGLHGIRNFSTLKRHHCPLKDIADLQNVLRSWSPTPLLSLHQQPCNHHEVVRKHGSPYKQFESLTTLSQASLHATAAEENGDPPLDAGTEALSVLEGWTLLVGSLGGGFLSAALGNAHEFNASVLAQLGVVSAEKSAIGTVDPRSVTECLLVAFQGGCDVDLIRGIPMEHPILGDQTAGALRKVDFMAEYG